MGASAGGTKWYHTNRENCKPKQKRQVLVQPVLCLMCDMGLNCATWYRASIVQQLQEHQEQGALLFITIPWFSCPPSFAHCLLKGVTSVGWWFQWRFASSSQNSYKGLGKLGFLYGEQGGYRGEDRLGSTAVPCFLALLSLQFWNLITSHLTPSSANLHQWFFFSSLALDWLDWDLFAQGRWCQE